MGYLGVVCMAKRKPMKCPISGLEGLCTCEPFEGSPCYGATAEPLALCPHCTSRQACPKHVVLTFKEAGQGPYPDDDPDYGDVDAVGGRYV